MLEEIVMKTILLKFRWIAAIGLVLFALQSHAVNISDVRVWNSPDKTRIVFDVSEPVKYKLFALKSPDRVVIDVANAELSGGIPGRDKLGDRVKRIRTGKHENSLRFVLDLKTKVRNKHFTLKPNDIYGNRLVVDLFPASKKSKKKIQRSSNDKFVVVIDPGHGGEDPGAVGARKTLEKHVVLKISKMLKKELNSVPGIRAELTRTGDYYIPLRRRTRIATDMDADLFVSIHADAFTRRSASGISVFALSERGATSERARVLANKENASDVVAGENLSHRDHDVAEILTGLSFAGKIERSISLGAMTRTRLSRVGKLHGHGVEQAGFVVLKAPSIPSILIEVGFISNPKEEKSLNTRSYQAKIAKEIKTGIVQYAKKYPWGQDKWRTAWSQ